MAVYLDMMDFPVEVAKRPMRIVSLVPSLSLLLHDLGVGPRLVGVTKFCVHPGELRSQCTVVGGTKMLHMDVISSLNPDLILANKEENNQVDVEALQEQFPVWISDISNLDEALYAIEVIGNLVDCSVKAQELYNEIQAKRKHFQTGNKMSGGKVAYVIWNNPLMAAGKATFIDSMLKEAGWTNAFEEHERYPAFTAEALETIKPDLVFLSSEPFPFKEKHKALFKETHSTEEVYLVDGEMFSWYGSRLKDSFDYFDQLQKQIKQ